MTPIENIQETDDKSSMLLPVPLDTKIDETNLKAHVMQLYPDLFDGSRDYQECCGSLGCKARCNPHSMFTQEGPRCTWRLIKERIKQDGVHESNSEIGYQRSI